LLVLECFWADQQPGKNRLLLRIEVVFCAAVCIAEQHALTVCGHNGPVLRLTAASHHLMP